MASDESTDRLREFRGIKVWGKKLMDSEVAGVLECWWIGVEI